jgi:hypothetical protein
MSEQEKIPIPLDEFKSSGNTFILIGKVMKAMKRDGRSKEDIQAFQERATSLDYNHVITECLKIVELI